jgi:hydroxyacylglutathione hydrolase
MLLSRLYNDKLAQTSWLVADLSSKEAIVIDPNRDVSRYVDAAQKEGVKIVGVTETHIHADFVSGARELAQRVGAKLYLSDAGEAPWKYAFAKESGAVLLNDGDIIEVGGLRFHVAHTPGHTPEHLSFILVDTAVSPAPIGASTGDFLFVGDVGRPDLLEKSAHEKGTTDAMARLLYKSVQKMRDGPDHLQIWPGHGAGSACGKGISAMPQSTLGYEKISNHAFSYKDEDAFVAGVLKDLTSPPPYFAEMKRINRDGPETLSGRTRAARVSVKQIAETLEKGGMVVDTRTTSDFAAEHIPGTINIPFNKSFVQWAGWLIPVDADVTLIMDARQGGGIDEAVRDLALIGIEKVTAWAGHNVVATWKSEGRNLDTTTQWDVEEMKLCVRDHAVMVVDVRSESEFADGHIEGAKNIPLGVVGQRAGEIPTDRPIVVHCQGGTRSSIAASVLQKQGMKNVINLTGGFGAWKKAGGEVKTEGTS